MRDELLHESVRPLRLRVAHLGYSVNPWRIISEDGTQLLAPAIVGDDVLSMPMSFPTKAAAIDGLGDLAGRLLTAALAEA